jgi:predicted kinase
VTVASADLPESSRAFGEVKPLVIIVSGPPCTGKTTLGQRIARELEFPFVNKDGIKELLFDRLGWKDDEWSKKLSLASHDVLCYLAAAQLATGGSLVVESTFKAEADTPRFLALQEQFDFYPLQIQCRTQGEVLLERFKARIGQRHPGHVDHEIFERLKPVLLQGRYEPLGIGGPVIEVDTTDLQAIDYAHLFQTIQSAISSISPKA